MAIKGPWNDFPNHRLSPHCIKFSFSDYCRLLNSMEQQEGQRVPFRRNLHQRHHPCDRSPLPRGEGHSNCIHCRCFGRTGNNTAQPHHARVGENLQLNPHQSASTIKSCNVE